MHTTIELNVDATVMVREGKGRMVELVFIGGQDDGSLVVKAYPAQVEALMKGFAALAPKADDQG